MHTSDGFKVSGVTGDTPPMLRLHKDPVDLFEGVTVRLGEEEIDSRCNEGANDSKDNIRPIADLGKADWGDLGDDEIAKPMGLLPLLVRL